MKDNQLYSNYWFKGSSHPKSTFRATSGPVLNQLCGRSSLAKLVHKVNHHTFLNEGGLLQWMQNVFPKTQCLLWGPPSTSEGVLAWGNGRHGSYFVVLSNHWQTRPEGQNQSATSFINKVLSEHGHTHFFKHCLLLLSCCKGRTQTCHRDCVSQRAKMFRTFLLTENVCCSLV